jgi:hypothetical protein
LDQMHLLKQPATQTIGVIGFAMIATVIIKQLLIPTIGAMM